MSLKIEVVPGKNGNPPILILDDKETYPIKDVRYQGETDRKFASFDKTFVLTDGVLFFVDIFDYPHYCLTSPEDRLELSQESKWKGRMDRLKEKNELKRLPPWFWNDVPQKDWPTWMMN